MFKLIVLVALAFQGILAHHHHEHDHHHETQEILEHVRTVSHDAVNAIENAHVRDHQLRHVLGHEAHELAHNVHQIAYHLQQVIYHNYNGQNQEVLVGVVRHLYDTVYAIQKALREDPTNFQSQLRVQIENLVVEGGKLGSVVEQEQNSEDVNNELYVVLDDLLVAIQQFHIRSQIVSEHPEDIDTQVKTTVNEVVGTIKHINVRDEEALHKIVHYAHHLAHHIGEIIHKLERESHHHHEQIRDVLRQVINNLSEIRVNLEQAQHDSAVEQLLRHLDTIVHEISTQLQRLVQLIHSVKLDEQEAVNLKNVVQTVVAHTVAAERQLQRNIEHLAERDVEYHQEN